MATRTPYAPSAGEVLTAANLAKFAKGWIADAEVTSNQSGVSTEADLTGMTITFTAEANRKYRIQFFTPRIASGAGDDIWRVTLKEGATTMATMTNGITQGGQGDGGGTLTWRGTFSAGSHTVKMTLQRVVGTGTLTASASATDPMWMMVEDIGPAS